MPASPAKLANGQVDEDDHDVLSESGAEDATEEEEEDCIPYGDTAKFHTWHKHVRDFYQTNVFVDTTWTSRSAQFMPYLTLSQHQDTVTQTVLTGTYRQDGQNYIQMLDTTLPVGTGQLKGSPLNLDTYEVGGYGVADVSKCGVKVSRRMYHDGAVLACRYMPTNPLVIASSSSNGNCYIFDVSRSSLSKPPNDLERPTYKYAPRALPEDATEEQKRRFAEKAGARAQAEVLMSKWDARTGAGQHMLTLTGNKGHGVTMDWCLSNEGVLACGSDESVAFWKIGNLSKTDPKTVEPFFKACFSTLINDVKFSPFDTNRAFVAVDDATVSRCDVREGRHSVVVSGDVAKPATLSMSPLNDVVLAVGGTDGCVRVFDQRNFSSPVVTIAAHNGQVGPMSWSPFVEGFLATGGQDGLCALIDCKSSQLLFKHAAHVETILDVDWNWQERNQGHLISCDENAVSIWKPRNIFWTP